MWILDELTFPVTRRNQELRQWPIKSFLFARQPAHKQQQSSMGLPKFKGEDLLPSFFPHLISNYYTINFVNRMSRDLREYWRLGSTMVSGMKFLIRSSWCVVLLLFLWPAGFAQEPKQPSSGQATIQVQSSLVLVDVISRDPKTGLPVRDFKKEDFRLFDNRQEVQIVTFDAGAQYDTRPITVWLVVICNEGGIVGASAEFMGKESLFRPALDHLQSHDTVGVAHWCDNGETRLDLLPTEDRDSPIRVLAETLKPVTFKGGTDATDEVGEETFRKMIRLIIGDAYRRNPKPLPVIVFLHGDHTGQPRRELDKLVDDFLETSGTVFGIRDYQSAVLPFLIGEQAKILHYMAKHTGGQYFSAPPSGYADALEAILKQLHFRYELGFVPAAIDGKRHELTVELTKEAHKRHNGARLRFRPEYIAVSEPPDWAR